MLSVTLSRKRPMRAATLPAMPAPRRGHVATALLLPLYCVAGATSP
jgi:hypothetical protein